MALELGTNSGFVTTRPTADPAGTDAVIDGASVVTKHTTPTGAIKITEVGWYRGSGTNTANFEIALYANTSNVAAVRLYVDATNSSSSSGWITTAVDWNVSADTDYWLAVQMDAHSGSSNIDTAASGGAGYDRMTSQSALADPYGGGAVADADGMAAIYALVSVARNITAGLGELTLIGFAPTATVAAPQTAPTVALNTTDATGFLGEDTPLLEFTGTDANSDDVLYEIQIDTANTFDTGNLLDKVSGTDAGFAVLGAEEITNGTFDSNVTSWSAPVGTLSHYATDSDSIGRVNLAKEVVAATLDNVRFGQTLASALTANETYVLRFGYLIPSSNDAGGCQRIQCYLGGVANQEAANVSTVGTYTRYSGTFNFVNAKTSVNFRMHDTAQSDAGMVTGDKQFIDNVSIRRVIDGTSPFTSATKCSYRVQDANALADGTYYWRVRAKDPSGSNTYGDWSETRTFTVGSPNKEATPGVGALLLTGFAATVFATNLINVTPALGQLDLTGFNPTVVASNHIAVNSSLGQLTLDGFAPDVTATNNQVVTPGLGELLLAGYAPTVATSDNKNITTDLGSLTLSGFTPTIFASDLKNITPSLGQLDLAGFSPTIFASNHISVNLSLGILTLEGFIPSITVSDNKEVSPSFGSLLLTGYEPTVFASDLKNITTQLGELLLTGFAPSLVAVDNKEVTPGLGKLLLTGFVPTVSASDHKNITTDLGTLLLSGFEPVVFASDSQGVTPGLGQLTLTGFELTILVSDLINIDAGLGALTLEGFAPAIALTDNKNITAGLGSLVLTGFQSTVTVSNNKTVSPSLGSLLLTGFLPGIVATVDDWRNPSSLTETVGTAVSGTIADVYIDSDATELVLSEVAGTPGFDYTFEFGIGTDVPSTLLHLYVEGYYDGNAAHIVKLQQWNYDTSGWVDVSGAVFPDAVAEQSYKFRLINDPDYISSGNIKLRIVHTSAGNPVYQFHLDKFYIDLTEDKEVLPGTGQLIATGYAPSVYKTAMMYYWDSASWNYIGHIKILS